MLKLVVLVLVGVAVASAATTKSTRPRACPVGTTYKKDCNTCTCAANVKDDKCSQLDCSRASAAAKTTERPKSDVRPGTCPTIAAEPAGSNACKNRDPTSKCAKDTECGGAKKCCVDGCGTKLCRNPIYNYTR